MKHKKYIIWDWNGTMLDDTGYCVDCMNTVLDQYNINRIDIDLYRENFTFPVKDYYEAIGFDFSKVDFEKPAMEFINLYYSNIENAGLANGIVNILSYFKKRNIKQFCLSAMEHGELVNSLNSKGIFEYFEEVRGINDHYANSKVEVGKSLLKSINANKNDILMIGDTIHDFEVATELGIDCLLVANGHQSFERLQKVTENIISDLSEVMERLID